MSQTLVLNQGYQPTAVVSWQQAIRLFFLDKVEIVREYEDRELRSTHLVIKMPAVVRLLKSFKRKPRPVKFNRINIHARDKGSCQYCGKKVSLKESTYDHIKPRSQGGKTTWENVVISCVDCNSTKGGRTPEQAGMRLRSVPVKPKTIPTMAIKIHRERAPAAWRDFLYWTGELDN